MNRNYDDALQSIAETVMWFRQKPFEDWKKAEFRTPSLLDEYVYGTPPSMRNYDYDRTRSIVAELVTRRCGLLSERAKRWTDLRQGRLLRHNFQETTNTDIPRLATDGFFDSWDVPAWDFWVAFVVDDPDPCDAAQMNNYLITWVPDELHDMVNQTIEASFEENLLWLDETSTEFSKGLFMRM